MSDPMSNREIEDVLTSIRRLVAQEGDRAPETIRETIRDTARAGKGRLVLTEAQRIDPLTLRPGQRADAAVPLVANPPADPAPAEAQSQIAEAVVGAEVTIPAPDFGRLEATIAELEAAVSAAGDGFEGMDSDEAPKASNVTELYGRLSFAHRAGPAEAEAAAPGIAPLAAPAAAAVTPAAVEPARPAAPAQPGPETAGPETAGPETAAAPQAAPQQAAPVEAMLDDAAPEDTILDEDTLRDLIAQIVREELRGAMGERITQQVRKLVRAEVAKALDDRGFL